MSGCRLSFSDLVEVLHARLLGDDGVFHGVCTDSRRLRAGELFVALAGPNFNGHDHVHAAAARGAVAAMVAHPVKTELPQLVVGDTRLALGELASHWRGRFTIPLIAVTGSNGKTTVKEMLAAILARRAPVLATEGNLNNEIGVPLTLLRLDKEHGAAVVEEGASRPGDIAYLTRLAQPTVGVVTNAAGAHLAGFGSLERVARSKGELFEGLPVDGIAVINADDAFASLWREQAGARRSLSFGLEAEADVRGEWRPGEALTIHTPSGDLRVDLPLPGRHNAMNALAATAAALAAGAGLADIEAGLQALQPVPGRLCRRRGPGGSTLLDDTYNANPASLAAALAVLVAEPGAHWLALGDMAELGGDAAEQHAEAGRRAAEAGVERLYGVGDLTHHAVTAFAEHGGGQAHHFSSREALVERLQEDLMRDVTLLVKGSRTARMDEVVAVLAAEAD